MMTARLLPRYPLTPGRCIAAAVALSALVVPAGCNGDDLVEGIAERRLEAETGDDVDIDISDGDIRLRTADGEISIETDDDGRISASGFDSDGEFTFESDPDAGTAIIETEDGRVFESGNDALPEGFPTDVPVPDGTIEFVQVVTGESGPAYTIMLEAEGSTLEMVPAYLDRLAAAGFEQNSFDEGDGFAFFEYTDETYTVIGTMTGDGGTADIAINVEPVEG